MEKHNTYVNIHSFNDGQNRKSFNELMGIYQNEELLLSAIQEIMGNRIDFNDKRVLLKPNWVLHDRRESDEYALCTHPKVIIAVSRYILMHFRPKTITIGDAPLQDCLWDKMIKKPFTEEIKKLADNFDIPINIKDYRRVSMNFSKNKLTENKAPLSDYLIFDVGRRSALEPITLEKTQFRVTNYDPSRMKEAHGKGYHKYCITKDIFEHDIIITLPKIKTHQKAGITGALKILVGINGDKDFLPHHRKGGDKMGGDCYPGKNRLKYATESFLDLINKHRGKPLYNMLRIGAVAFWKYALFTPTNYIGAAWYGNDTCWRMVSDLNLIAKYGTSNGNILTEEQREIFSLSDGIIGGQGNGPLNPEPLNLGVMLFSNNAYLNDYVISKLLTLKTERIPLIRDLDNNTILGSKITLNNSEIRHEDLTRIAVKAKPAPGWEILTTTQ
ncbi:MAG: DUF362 domain-containing protein [Bacteroidales bacterium]|nr:DUF362 domain-containing protein [Bacteroidales bacterium]